MTRQAILAIVVGILILFGGVGAFLYSKNKPADTTSNATVSTEITDDSNGNLQGTIKDILSSGDTSTCTFSTSGPTSDTAGTVYVSEDKARGNFVTTIDGKNTNSHLLRDGDTFYVWGDGIPTGMKMTMSIDQMTSAIENDSTYSSIDPNMNVEYKCDSWTEDPTVFTPPSNIKFTSMDSLMQMGLSKAPTGAQSNPPGAASNECAICNSLSGQAKTACQEQFSCN